MKAKSFLLLLMAAGCGLVATYGAMQLNGDGTEDVESVLILVAKYDIPPYVPLTDAHVEFKNYPKELEPLGAVKTVEEYDRRALRAKVYAGHPIVKANLGEPGDFDASTEIPEGYRVYTVPINMTSSHSGQIQPKDRVDIYVTYESRESGSDRDLQTKTKLIIDYVEVFSIDNDRDKNSPNDKDTNAKNVSLVVTPEQAAILMMAGNKGSLSLTLRPKNETARVEVSPLTEAQFDILGTNATERDKVREEHEQALADLEKRLLEEKDAELAEAEAARKRLEEELNKKPTVVEKIVEVPVEVEKVVEVIPEVKKPESWKIRVIKGTETEETEFELTDKEDQESDRSPKKSDEKGDSEQDSKEAESDKSVAEKSSGK